MAALPAPLKPQQPVDRHSQEFLGATSRDQTRSRNVWNCSQNFYICCNRPLIAIPGKIGLPRRNTSKHDISRSRNTCKYLQDLDRCRNHPLTAIPKKKLVFTRSNLLNRARATLVNICKTWTGAATTRLLPYPKKTGFYTLKLAQPRSRNTCKYLQNLDRCRNHPLTAIPKKNRLLHAQTCSNLLKLAQTCSNLLKHARETLVNARIHSHKHTRLW